MCVSHMNMYVKTTAIYLEMYVSYLGGLSCGGRAFMWRLTTAHGSIPLSPRCDWTPLASGLQRETVGVPLTTI